MKRSSQQNQENQRVAALVQAENERLKLREQELTYQAALVEQPFVQEQMLRDQKWLKLPDEQNLELSGYKYEPRQLTLEQPTKVTVQEQWQQLLSF